MNDRPETFGGSGVPDVLDQGALDEANELMSLHPVGSVGYKENADRISALFDRAYGETPAGDYEPPPFEEGSPAHVLAQSEEGRSLMAKFGGGDSQDFADFVSYAKAEAAHIEQSDPGVAAWAMDMHEQGVNIMSNPDVLQYLARNARIRTQVDGIDVEAAPLQRIVQPQERKEQMQKALTVPTHNEAIQDRIEEIHEKHPVGSHGYNSQRVQRELQALYSQLAGDGPVVGAQLRKV